MQGTHQVTPHDCSLSPPIPPLWDTDANAKQGPGVKTRLYYSDHSPIGVSNTSPMSESGAGKQLARDSGELQSTSTGNNVIRICTRRHQVALLSMLLLRSGSAEVYAN